MPPGIVCPTWASEAEGPKVLASQRLGEASGEEQEDLLAGNLRAAWIPQHGCC